MRITINGQIVADEDKWLYDWFDIPAVNPAAIRQALKDNHDSEELELEINSPGGSVFAGFEIYSLLRGAKCRTTAIVQSLAASAASTIACGCDRVQISPVAQIMIHLPTCRDDGDQNSHKHTAKMLESLTQSILNGYEAKCGGKCSRETLDKLIRAESWIDAQQAVELGLADEILGADGDAGYSVANSLLKAANAVGGIDSAALFARYVEAVKAGAKPANGHEPAMNVPNAADAANNISDDWRKTAGIEIERQRFLGGF